MGTPISKAFRLVSIVFKKAAQVNLYFTTIRDFSTNHELPLRRKRPPERPDSGRSGGGLAAALFLIASIF